MENKRVLFIDSSFHKKTKSNMFLREYLKEHYNLEEVYDDEWIDCDLAKYFAIIFFQILPAEEVFQKIKHNNIIFFPMYDDNPNISFAQCYPFRRCKVVSFSKTLNEKLTNWGFDSTFVQYFPKPNPTENLGDENSMFFWQRTSDIDITTVEKIVGEENISHLYFHRAIDPKYEIIEPNKNWDNKISYSNWFADKNDLLRVVEKSALYFAPRKYEGIGLSFLEAMAMGRVVIGMDLPTMNEYITDGENGFLYKNKKIEINNIRDIQKRVLDFMEKGHQKWIEDRKNILFTIEKELKLNILKSDIIFKYYLNFKNKKFFRFKLGKNGYLILFWKKII